MSVRARMEKSKIATIGGHPPTPPHQGAHTRTRCSLCPSVLEHACERLGASLCLSTTGTPNGAAVAAAWGRPAGDFSGEIPMDPKTCWISYGMVGGAY